MEKIKVEEINMNQLLSKNHYGYVLYLLKQTTPDKSQILIGLSYVYSVNASDLKACLGERVNAVKLLHHTLGSEIIYYMDMPFLHPFIVSDT